MMARILAEKCSFVCLFVPLSQQNIVSVIALRTRDWYDPVADGFKFLVYRF